MKVGSKAVMKFRDTKPLPSEITDERVNNATLPVKIETARRAIAACRDLPELLRYRDQAEGLAAAVRTMKQVGPEMIRAANCLMADAWRKGGELLSQYSGSSSLQANNGRGKSARSRVASELGLNTNESMAMVRIARAPIDGLYAAVQKSASITKVARAGAPAHTRTKTYTDHLRGIMGSEKQCGLTHALGYLRRMDLANFALLTPDERKVVKAKITEIVELLDEMDRLCR